MSAARPFRLMAVLVLAVPALGLASAADSLERGRIATERRAAETRYAWAQADCQTRFVVTECLDAARAERRQALDGLQKRQLVLDDARRRERATERLTVQRARAAEQAKAASAPLPLQAGTPAAGASKLAPAAVRPDRSAEAAAAASATRQTEAAAAQRHRAAYDQRQQAARQHQQALAARNARQDAVKAPAAGLPAQGASRANNASR